MDQITAFFEGINLDDLMNVVATYVEKIDVNKMMIDFSTFFSSAFQAILGGLVAKILG